MSVGYRYSVTKLTFRTTEQAVSVSIFTWFPANYRPIWSIDRYTEHRFLVVFWQ